MQNPVFYIQRQFYSAVVFYAIPDPVQCSAQHHQLALELCAWIAYEKMQP